MSLKFGTSGLRGLVSAMTAPTCARYAQAFLRHARRVSPAAHTLVVGGDRRESTPAIIQAVLAGAQAEGWAVEYLGGVPTPALAARCLAAGQPGIMVTGSHIPADRNGLKFYLASGEILKRDEAAIAVLFRNLQAEQEGRPPTAPLTLPPLPTPDPRARTAYLARFLQAWPADALAGLKLVVYEHSAVGHELLAELLRALGASVTSVGGSTTFVPVDTEAIEDPGQLASWVRAAGAQALLSTDGDGDRPLMVDEYGVVLAGDLLGLLAARALGADAVALPISCTSAVERSGAFASVRRTRIGSPFVIEGMGELRASGAQRVVGFEANGGFLTASDLVSPTGAPLPALPTRDAILPMLAVLAEGKRRGLGLAALCAELPPRYTASGLLRDFPSELGQLIVARVREHGAPFINLYFKDDFGAVQGQDFTDGARLQFPKDLIIHLRPSGNAPEFRIYTEAGTLAAAEGANESTRELLRHYLRPAVEPAATAQAGGEHDAMQANLAAMTAPPRAGQGMAVVIVVTGSPGQEQFWQQRLEATRGQLTPPEALVLAVREDWPGGAGNGLGTLYAWEQAVAKAHERFGVDLNARLRAGAAVGMYHTAGLGTRLAPLPGSEGNNKPGVKLPGLIQVGERQEAITVLESVIRQTAIYAPGRAGRLSVFWGDQLFVPSRRPPTQPSHHADILCRLGGMPDEAAWKVRGLDRYGLLAVNARGHAAQLEKISYAEARRLVDGALVSISGGIGVSLGSFSLSHELLAGLLAEFAPELAARQGKFDSDPHFWMAMSLDLETYSTLLVRKGEDRERVRLHHQRLQAFAERFQQAHPQLGLLGAVDVGTEGYWWDFGQLEGFVANIRKLTTDTREGQAIRAFFGVESRRAASELGPGVEMDAASVVLGCQIRGGSIRNSVLVGVTVGQIEAEDSVLLRVSAPSLRATRAIGYNIAEASPLRLRNQEVRADAFVPGQGQLLFKTTINRDGRVDWAEALPWNPISFKALAELNAQADPVAAQAMAEQAHEDLRASLCSAATEARRTPPAPNRVYPLENRVQYYAWGSRRALAELLSRPTPSVEPEAELWIGAHPKASSAVIAQGHRWPLTELLSQQPEGFLGPAMTARYGGQLPFLFKVLAAAQPLSLQAHPNQLQARAGFERENSAGLPLNSPQRNYRDANHKPELICALTEFHALKGFRPPAQISEGLRAATGDLMAPLLATLQEPGEEVALRTFFGQFLRLPPATRDALLAAAASWAASQAQTPEGRWVTRLLEAYPGDLGALAPLIFNLVRLTPGETLYQPAGELHAYLEGVGLELMANSDNVLRGGLTSKHTDVAELLSVLDFRAPPVQPGPAAPLAPGLHEYASPAAEFALARLQVAPGHPWQRERVSGLELWLCTEGQGELYFPGPGGRERLRFAKGASFLVPAAVPALEIHGLGTLFRASLGPA